jgi:hypothetical protein
MTMLQRQLFSRVHNNVSLRRKVLTHKFQLQTATSLSTVPHKFNTFIKNEESFQTYGLSGVLAGLALVGGGSYIIRSDGDSYETKCEATSRRQVGKVVYILFDKYSS